MLNTSSKYILEIACFNIESCKIAQEAGADRIEFCADYALGGVTPNHEDILEARKILDIPLHVIVRPRGGNFVYSIEEIEAMKRAILFCKDHAVDGVVFGVLTENNSVDKIINEDLLQIAKPMITTFHRAIEQCKEIDEAMNDLINLNFNKVLTSGGKQKAIDGIDCISLLSKKYKQSISIIVGGLIRSDNINYLLKTMDCYEYHSSAITNTSGLTDKQEVRKLKSILNE